MEAKAALIASVGLMMSYYLQRQEKKLFKKLLGLSLVVLFGFTAGICLAKYSGGDGTSATPYRISNANDMNEIGAHPNDWNDCFLLTSDVNMVGYTYTTALIAPDTNSNNFFQGTAFSGVFDGGGYTITGLRIDDGGTGNWYLGLFGQIDGGEVRNAHLVDVNLCGLYKVGGLVGKNRGKVTQCSVTGVISGKEDVGGLIGENRDPGCIEKCRADVKIQHYGILGVQSYVGGLVGWNNEADIIDCSSSGNLDGNNNTDSVGGLVGANYGRIERCYSTADVKGSWCIGGLVGVHNRNDLQSCYATGNVLAEVRGGGLVGFSTNPVVNCYATGDVNCTSDAGGLIGEEGYGGAINCYSTGYVTGNQDVGGLVGVKYSTDGFIGCFWDVNTSGQTTSAGGIGKSTLEMQTEATFTDAGWDFIEIWNIGENQTYPYLRVYPAGDLNHDGRVDGRDLAIIATRWLDGIQI